MWPNLVKPAISLFSRKSRKCYVPILGVAWGRGARSNWQASLQSTYRRHEQEKKLQYEQRIRDSTFTPLVLSTTGGRGRAATTFFKRLAAMQAKWEKRCSLEQNDGMDSLPLELCSTKNLNYVCQRGQIFCLKGSTPRAHWSPSSWGSASASCVNSDSFMTMDTYLFFIPSYMQVFL